MSRPAASPSEVPAPPAARPAAALLSVRDLRVHFDTGRGKLHAVDGVSFDLHDGETLGLVGETGSGKSVTARSLLRLVPTPPGVYAGGEVLFRPRTACPACAGAGCDRCGGAGRVPTPCTRCAGEGCAACEQSGRDTVDLLKVGIRRLRTIRGNRIAMIFQDPGKALNPVLPVREQLAEVFAEHRAAELLAAAGLGPDALLRRAARRRSSFWERRVLRVPPLRGRHRRLEATLDDWIARALADTRIASPRKVMQSYPHELSGGMQQRVMIAQALACDPDLLIADEPTTALDVTVQARILDLIVELQQRHGTAVLYISHDLSLVRRVSDRVAVMYAGRLAETGPAGGVFAHPLHPYTRGLLTATPRPDQRRGELTAIEGTVPELVDPEPACRFHTRCGHAAAACRRIEPELADPAPGRAGAGQRVACLLYGDAGTLGVAPGDLPVERPGDATADGRTG